MKYLNSTTFGFSSARIRLVNEVIRLHTTYEDVNESKKDHGNIKPIYNKFVKTSYNFLPISWGDMILNSYYDVFHTSVVILK